MQTLRKRVNQIARELLDYVSFADEYPDEVQIAAWANKIKKALADTKDEEPPTTLVRVEDGPWLPVPMTTDQLIEELKRQKFVVEPIPTTPEETGVQYFRVIGDAKVEPFDGYVAVKEGA